MNAPDYCGAFHELVGACGAVRKQADNQAEDPALWADQPDGSLARRLQRELRELHAAVNAASEIGDGRARDLKMAGGGS
jgi:hypothetical protein